MGTYIYRPYIWNMCANLMLICSMEFAAYNYPPISYDYRDLRKPHLYDVLAKW